MSAAEANSGYRLPETLPEGETILWQGRPGWLSLAIRAFHVRTIAIYFGIIVVWRAAAGLREGLPISQAAADAVPILLIALGAIALLAGLAWIYRRTTTYTITNRRVFMHYGAALPMMVNVPFKIVGVAGAKVHSDGTADIPLRLTGNGRLAYLHLWPHARPWRLTNPEPMLRSVPDGARVATLLADALAVATPPPAAAQAVAVGRHTGTTGAIGDDRAFTPAAA